MKRGATLFVPVASRVPQPRRHRRGGLASIKEAIELCIEDMAERGEEIPDPSGTLIGTVVITQ